MRLPSLFVGLALGASALLTSSAHAQNADAFVVGILTDMNGPVAYVAGPKAVEAAKMAIEDFGGKVLGRKIELLVADHQNKTDVGSAVAREWYDTKNVRAIFDVNNSSIAFAVKDLAVARDRTAVFVSAASSDLTGAQCSPNTFHWAFDTYSQTQAVSDAITKNGGKNWFYLTVDYTFGKALEKDSQAAVKKAGGTVLGSAYAPLGTQDYSSYLLQAQSKKPDVLAFANTSTDMINSVKQAKEFGVTGKTALFFFQLFDADILGLDVAKGARFLDSFYWDMNDETRAWTKRFVERTGSYPGSNMANFYGAMLHYLKAVQAAGTDDNKTILTKFRETPVNDFYTKNAKIREDGRLLRAMYLLEVKEPSQSKGKWDYFKVVDTLPDGIAFKPAAESACPLLKK